MPPLSVDGLPMQTHTSGAIAASSSKSGATGTKRSASADDSDNESLFGSVPDDKKRKFILVADEARGARVRVRVTLDTVDPQEIPDSYRRSNSVYPRSWFPLEMQDPPPSAKGSRFFASDDEDEVDAATERAGGPQVGRTLVPVPMLGGELGEVAVPRTRRAQRAKEVKLNDLGYRMTWHQSRVFAGRRVFLQKACEYLFFSFLFFFFVRGRICKGD